MKYGVIIVTYNRLNLLKECIEAILNQTKKFDDVIVVDNGSNDGTKEYLCKIAEKTNFCVLRYENNYGGAFGFSEGLKKAVNKNIDWFLLIDDDAILNGDFNEVICKFIENDKNRLEAYSCTVLTFEKIYIRHRTRHMWKNFYWLKSVSLKEYEDEYFDCDSGTFCGLVVSKKIVNEIGFPNDDYFIWGDDEEYCERIYRISKIRNVNKAILNHKTNATFNELSWKMYYGARNLIDSVKQHYGIFNLSICIIRIVLRALKYVVLADKYQYTRKEIIKMYFDALRDGLQGKLGVNPKYYPNTTRGKKKDVKKI